MGFEIVRGPFILLEAIGMLYKFVNGISFRSVLNRNRYLGGSTASDATIRRMECLQRIMDRLCVNLDPMNPELQFFFCRLEINGEETCIARLLTGGSFSTLSQVDIHAHGESICDLWDSIQRNGGWITPSSSGALDFRTDEGCPGDLFDQICALQCSAETHVRLYKALRDFHRTMADLVRQIEPLGQRLEQEFSRESWLMDEAEQYWQEVFSQTSPLEFLRTCCGDDDSIGGASDHTLVAISYMNSNQISYSMAEGHHGKRRENVLIIGSVATSASLIRSNSHDLEQVGSILKLIGDKKRMETLRRLAKGRSYCHELADQMGVDPGNMSRTLTQLHGFGFLRQDRETLINYYEADREAFHSFLELVEETIFD